MRLEESVMNRIMDPERSVASEEAMIHKARWEEVRRLFFIERATVSEIGRRLDLDRKTVRKCLRQEAWRPYRRAPQAETLLGAHANFLRERAPQVAYSGRILFQELRSQRGYSGSYETVKRFLAPLREIRDRAELCQTRFETAPGEQSQIDWGQAKVHFRARALELHIFVLTLGYSRRAFCRAFADERLSQFLEAHEAAFEHFGGLTREHLYDRPRTVCYQNDQGRTVWNPTFKAFADYWGFEPRVCRPYRAQTKGKVESGVKYLRRNFLPGREFIDMVDFDAQLDEWNATVSDVRIHGTTHEKPIERFAAERAHLTPIAGHGSFRHEARRSRIVAEDYLVSVGTNRYSVPFTLIGQPVEIEQRDAQLFVYHRDRLVATHMELPGKHQLSILPEHGPGAIARTRRQRRATECLQPQHRPWFGPLEVEVRDPAAYEVFA